MAKTNAERQREYKERHSDKLKRLDILLPVNESKLLHGNAKKLGISKADYIVKLLHGNRTLVDCEKVANNEVRKQVLPDNEKVPVETALHGNNEYDGTTPLQPVIAELLGLSLKSQREIAKATKQAKQALGINLKARTLSTVNRMKVYLWLEAKQPMLKSKEK